MTLNLGVRENLAYHIVDAWLQTNGYRQSYKVKAILIKQGRYNAKGNSQWGMHQPATNQELHFAVTPASQMAAGVFPVKPITNTTYTYDAAGQMTGKSGTGVSPVSYSYDAARNMKQCVFDGGNRTNSYYYDHARRLVKETHTVTGVTEESSTFVYDGSILSPKLTT